MTRQLLRDSRVVIEHEGSAYEFKALSSISGSTTLNQVTGRRKTLFANNAKQFSVTSRVDPTRVSLSVYVTSGFPESILFELLGMHQSNGALYVPTSLARTPKLCAVNIINYDSQVRADYCFVESINLTFNKSTPLLLEVVLNAAALDTFTADSSEAHSKQQGPIVAPTPVNLRLGNERYNSITSVGLSFQQEASWRDGKSLFYSGNAETYRNTEAFVEDFIVSSTVAGNYLTDQSKSNVAEEADFLVSNSGFTFVMEKAKIIHNFDLQSIYKYRLDVSYTEDSGAAYIYFGE